MGMQKYRADVQGETQQDGGIPFYAEWQHGRTLALIRNCRMDNLSNVAPRTVYITGGHDTWFSQPAVCKIAGCTVRGYVTSDDDGLHFRQTYY